MSCGNRFQCGLRKPTRFSFQPDKPSNPELHNENEKRLSDLLKAREEIDKQFFLNTTKSSDTTVPTQKNIVVQNEMPMMLSNTDLNTNFTPWRTPSAEYKSK